MHRNNEFFYETLEYNESLNYLNIDNHFRQVALNMGGKEVVIPAMIKRSVLERCGYFQSFPQHLTVVNSYFNEETETDSTQQGNNSINTDMFLTPAACLHIYPMLEGENLSDSIITTKAKVYRYEGDRHDGSTRLWDFSVREIVAVGSERFVINTLSNIQKEALSYCQELKIEAEVKNATDPFYPSKRNEKIKKIQRINNLKKELVTNIDGKEVAIASFNIHGTHFSKPFNFDQSGTVVTGCVGFGLERLVAAIRSQNKQEEN